MRRVLVLGMVIVIGGLATLAAQPAANAPKVIEVEKVKDNLFVLRGGGGNTAVFVTANGVTVVDAKNPGWGAPILAKIKELTPKPVTMLINTHTHGDHVSGNVEFPASVEVVAQVNTKANMEKMPIFKEHNNAGMAKRTFTDKLTIGKGADQVDLYYSGDIFAGKSVPLIDSANGGSMVRVSETLMKAHDGIKNVDTIINGHTPAQTTWADLKEYSEFNKDLVDWMRAGLKAGKTPEALAAEWKLPEKYKGYSANVTPHFGGLVGRIQTLQKEIQ